MGFEYSSRSMKRRIFRVLYLPPIIIVLVWWIGGLLYSDGPRIFFGIAVAIFSVLGNLLSDRQYLSHLEFNESDLRLEYVTPVLRSVKIQIAITEIAQIELTRRNW